MGLGEQTRGAEDGLHDALSCSSPPDKGLATDSLGLMDQKVHTPRQKTRTKQAISPTLPPQAPPTSIALLAIPPSLLPLLLLAREATSSHALPLLLSWRQTKLPLELIQLLSRHASQSTSSARASRSTPVRLQDLLQLLVLLRCHLLLPLLALLPLRLALGGEEGAWKGEGECRRSVETGFLLGWPAV